MSATSPLPRPATRCRVPGHDTWCAPAAERDRRYSRPTEHLLAMRYEDIAEHGEEQPMRQRR